MSGTRAQSDAERLSPSRPTTRAELMARLAELRPWLVSRGVKHLKLFGSYARDQASETSDVDLIVEFSEPVGLGIFQLQDELAARLGVKVELVSERALAPDIRFTALRDAIDA